MTKGRIKRNLWLPKSISYGMGWGQARRKNFELYDLGARGDILCIDQLPEYAHRDAGQVKGTAEGKN